DGHRRRGASEDCTGYADSCAGGAGASLGKETPGLAMDPSTRSSARVGEAFSRPALAMTLPPGFPANDEGFEHVARSIGKYRADPRQVPFLFAVIFSSLDFAYHRRDHALHPAQRVHVDLVLGDAPLLVEFE